MTGNKFNSAQSITAGSDNSYCGNLCPYSVPSATLSPKAKRIITELAQFERSVPGILEARREEIEASGVEDAAINCAQEAAEGICHVFRD